MKAVIPVAGVGSKLRPHTHTQPKALVSVAGKPLLSHIIDFLLKGGIHEFVFIIGYMGSKIEKHVKTAYKDKGIKMSFITQEPREGSAHAVLVAKNLLQKESEFLVMLGDGIVNMDIKKFLAQPSSSVATRKVDKPSLFGVAEMGRDGFVKRLIEKPSIPKSNLALVGLYKINNVPLFFESVESIIAQGVTSNGEYNLTDALMRMVESGEKISMMEVDSWYDCGKKESLLEANALLLKHSEIPSPDKPFDNTIIIPPVRIAPNCTLKNVIVGPNVVIGENSVVSNSIIHNAIIGSFCELDNLILNNSLVGNDAVLKGSAKSLNIGDHTEINFNL